MEAARSSRAGKMQFYYFFVFKGKQAAKHRTPRADLILQQGLTESTADYMSVLIFESLGLAFYFCPFLFLKQKETHVHAKWRMSHALPSDPKQINIYLMNQWKGSAATIKEWCSQTPAWYRRTSSAVHGWRHLQFSQFSQDWSLVKNHQEWDQGNKNNWTTFFFSLFISKKSLIGTELIRIPLQE